MKYSAWEHIQSDLFRYTGNTSVKAFAAQFIRNWGFRYSVWLRLCKSENSIIRGVARVLHWRQGKSRLVEIPHNTTIGYGLFLGHPMGIVVNATAKIGNNCNLSQHLTIGSNDGLAAEIGDDVYIGPHVCIVEHTRIGNGATVGAGAVVVKDVPENATVAGCPAVVISTKKAGRYISNRWTIR